MKFLNPKNILNVYLCVDAQIVLSWILSRNVKSKNIFARNRVKDIGQICDEINSEYSLKCQFKYVPTSENCADLVTRGLTYAKFLDQFDFWVFGAKFIRKYPFSWPENNLGCLSSENKTSLTCNVQINSESRSIFPLEKFSSIHKVFSITAFVLKYVFQFIIKKPFVREQTRMDYLSQAKIYWIKLEQSKYFRRKWIF